MTYVSEGVLAMCASRPCSQGALQFEKTLMRELGYSGLIIQTVPKLKDQAYVLDDEHSINMSFNRSL